MLIITAHRSKSTRVAVALLFLASLPVFAGDLAPDFDLPVLGGTPQEIVTLSDFRGKVVYVDFWAAWCRPCREALPFFDEVQQEIGSDQFQVIGINIDEDPDDGLLFLRDIPVSYPVVSDAQTKTVTAYKVKAMPTGFLLNRDGQIVLTHRGFRNRDKAQLRQAISDLVEGH